MRDKPIDTIEYKGRNIDVYFDDSPMNPRTDWDNPFQMIMFHNRYNLGDKHNYNTDDYSGWDDIQKQIEHDLNPVIILPVYMYDHSSIAFSLGSFNDHWDSGCVGFIILTRKELKEYYGWKYVTNARREELIRYAKLELETYQAYCNGEVFGYIIQDDDIEEACEDSCWGFYDMKYMLDEAKETIDRWDNDKQEKEWKHIPVLTE